MVIRLKSVELTGSVKDKPPKGPSKGDVLTARSRLFNVVPQFGKRAGAAVGSDVGTLTLTSPTTGTSVVWPPFPAGRFGSGERRDSFRTFRSRSSAAPADSRVRTASSSLAAALRRSTPTG